jgi:hypothetical protein
MVQKFQRIVTNVGQGSTTYKAFVTAPENSEVIVSPTRLVFAKKYDKRSYNVTIKYRGYDDKNVSFGELVWEEENSINFVENRNRTVRSPIVVSPKHSCKKF